MSLLATADARPNRATRRAHKARPASAAVAPAKPAVTSSAQKQARVAIERARQLEAQGVPALAEQQYRLAATTLPQSVDMARELARFYGRNARWDMAAATWRNVLALAPGHKDAEATAQMIRAQNQLLAASARPVVARNDFAPGTERTDSAVATPAGATSEFGSRFTSTRTAAQTAPGAATPEGTEALPAPAGAEPAPLPAGPAANVEPFHSAPGAPPVVPLLPPPSPLAPPPPAASATVEPAVEAEPAVVEPISSARVPAPAPAPRAVSGPPLVPVKFVAPAPKKANITRARAAKAWPLVNQAGKALTARQTTRALNLYKQAFAIDPTNQYAGPGVATSYVVLGRFNDAAATYRTLLAYKPNHIPYLRGLADSLAYARKYREAAGVNNRILQLKPGEFAASFSNAEIYTYARNYEVADRYFAAASKAMPGNASVLTAWGESLSYRQDPRAEATFLRVLQTKPNDARATAGLANYYSYVGNFGKAVPRYQAVLARDPRNLTALVGMGDALAFTGRPSAAVPYYNRALAVQPLSAPARLGLGRALVYAGRPNEGAEELRRVLAVRPDDVQALEALALAQGQTAPKAAENTYLSLIARQNSPTDKAQSLSALAAIKAQNGDYTGAIQAYNQAIALAPGDAKISLDLAQLLIAREEYEQASTVVNGVAATQPQNGRALALQTVIESKIGNPEQAKAMAQRLAQLSPADTEEALQLADALRSTGNTPASRGVLARAVANARTPADQIRLADGLRDSGDYPAAIELYNRQLASEPTNTSVRLKLAEVLIYEKDLGAANQQIQQVLNTDPNNVEAKVLQATVSLRGDTNESRAEAERQATAILAQNPNNSGAQVILGEVMTSRRKFADAIAQFRSAVAAEPSSLEARIGLARNLYYSRDVESAIVEYKEVIRRAPTDTVPKLELAQIYLDRNRFSEAEALYNDVLALRRSGTLLPTASRGRSRVMVRSLAKLSPLAQLNAPSRVMPSTGRRPGLARPGAKANSISARGTSRQRTLLAQLDSSAASSPGVLPAAPAPMAPPLLQGGPGIDGSRPAGTIGAPPSSSTAPVPAAPSSNLLSPAAPLPVLVPSGSTSTLSPTEQAAADEVAALRGLGEIRRRQSRFAEAGQFFNQALEVDATDAGARLGLAQSLRGQQKYVEALQQVDRVLSTEATNLQGRVLRAQLLGDTGKPAQAQEELDSLVASLPEDAPLETYQTLTQAFNSLNNFNASLQLLEVAAQDFPDEPAVPRLRAETLTFARRYPEAIALYDQLIAADPKDADAHLGKARVFNYSNRLPEAQAQYEQTLQVQPENYQALVELADVQSRRGNYPESIRLYQAAGQSNPRDLATRVELARVQRYAGKTADSEATLGAVLEADANYAPAYTERGILRGQTGSFDSGIADLNKALSITPTDINAQLGLAEVQGYAGRYPESIKGYRAVLTRDPQNLKARTELGLVLSYSGNHDEALKELDIALKQNATDSNLLIARADVLARSGRTAEAVTAYNRILTADPSNRRAVLGLADAYLYGSQFDNAVKTYDRLIVLEPNNSTYKIQRARALGYGGRHREATAALRQVVTAEPNNLNARLALAEVGTNSGNASLRNMAIGEYRSILQTAPDNVPARVGLARALSYRGDYREAETQLNTVLARNPGNTEARYALAETQRFANKPFDAKNNYEAVLAAQPNNAQARAGLNTVRRDTASMVTVGGSYYSDTNDVRVTSYSFGPTIRTRALSLGVIAERGKFTQGATERDRDSLNFILGKNFGPLQARLALTRLHYVGAYRKTLYDLGLSRSYGDRKRWYLGAAKRDIFESDAAVTSGITAQVYNAGFAYPLGRRLDFETQATYYRYSDDNDRIALSPRLYYRFRPTNPSLRVGLGYTYDNTDQLRTIYYTPQDFKATSVLADYVVDTGATRFGIFGAKSLTDATGAGGVNRPADTLFGFIQHDLNRSLELFANGGIVRTPTFKSDQVSGGVNLRF